MREFDDLVEELQLTFRVAQKPDGSYEIDEDGQVVDVSWGWDNESLMELRSIDPRCIWTVLDCDGKLYVSNGMHYVNRLYYLVTNKSLEGELKDFIF